MPKVTIEELIREQLSNQFDDSKFVEALMHMHAWVDGFESSPGQIASRYGFESSDLKQYIDVSSLGLHQYSNPTLVQAVNHLESKLPLPTADIDYELSCEIGATQNVKFGAFALMNAINAYGLSTGIQPVSKNLHRWLINDSNQALVNFAESCLPELVKRVEQDVIVHVCQLDNFLNRNLGEFTIEDFWKVVHGSPKLSAGTFPYIFAKEPDPNHILVKRIERLLSWFDPKPVPIDVLYRQVFRDQSGLEIHRDSLCGIEIQQAFTGFLLQCSYFSVEIEGVRHLRDISIEEALSRNERLVVDKLNGSKQGVQFDELEAFAHRCRCPEKEIERVLLSSPVITTSDDLMFGLIEVSELEQGPSPWSDEFRYPFWLISAGGYEFCEISDESTTLNSQGRTDISDDLSRNTSNSSSSSYASPAHSDEIIDLWTVSDFSWIGIYDGEIDPDVLANIEAASQLWTPVIERGSEKCYGAVRTSRLRNKYSSGNKHIELTDGKMKGKEICRFVDRVALDNALAEENFVFFNDGPGVWGLVFRKDV